jgi:hypothetical protein
MTPTHQHQLLKALHQPQKLQLLTLLHQLLKHQPLKHRLQRHQLLTLLQLKLPRLRNHRLLAACNGLLAGILLSAAGECSPT